MLAAIASGNSTTEVQRPAVENCPSAKYGATFITLTSAKNHTVVPT